MENKISPLLTTSSCILEDNKQEASFFLNTEWNDIKLLFSSDCSTLSNKFKNRSILLLLWMIMMMALTLFISSSSCCSFYISVPQSKNLPQLIKQPSSSTSIPCKLQPFGIIFLDDSGNNSIQSLWNDVMIFFTTFFVGL